MGAIPKVSLKPAPGFVIMKPVDDEEMEGLSISFRRKNCCVVVAVGDDSCGEFNGKVIKSPCKVGNTVYHTTTGYEEIYIDGNEYRVTQFKNIIAVV